MAEMPIDSNQNQTSETGPKAPININNPINVLIGDGNKSFCGYEEIAETKKGSDYFPLRQDSSDGFPENHEFARRHHTSDCTQQAERPRLSPRPHSSYETEKFRTRSCPIDNHNLPNEYAPASSSKRKPKAAFRIVNNSPEGISRRVEEFIKTIDDRIKDIMKTSQEKKEKEEQFIVHSILPTLQKYSNEWSKVGVASLALAKLVCAWISDTITTHALELLLQLVSRNKIGDGQADKIQQIEEIVRRSITSDFFFEQKQELQEKLIVVYSHLLILLLSETSKNNHFYFQFKSEELKRVVEKLEKCYSALSEPKKAMETNPQLKLVLDVISEAVERISKGSSRGEQHSGFLKEIQSALESTDDSTKITKQLKRYQRRHSNHSWFDVIFSIYHIHGQKNVFLSDKIKLIRCLIEGCKKEKSIFKSDQTQCREFLAAISVLFDIIIIHSGDKDVLTEAMESLCEWHKAADSFSISCKIKVELERYITRTLFGRNTQKIAARHLLDSGFREKENSQDHVVEYLKWFYRSHSFEPHSKKDLANDTFFTEGYFRGVSAVTKIHKVKVEEIAIGQQRLPDQFIKEAHYHHYLSSKQHPNLVQLLSFDTFHPPYHIITEHVMGESAQKYFENCSKNNYYPSQIFLAYLCLCIAKGAKLISDEGLVHRALTLNNILIADDGNHKITSMETVRPLSGTCNGSNANADGKGAKRGEKIPVYESEEKDYPITHASPESIRDGKFSTASDVWGFGVLLWEIFTFGRPAYSTVIDGNCLISNPALLRQYILEGKTLPREFCIREDIYSLMEKCWRIDPTQRPSFDDITLHLDKFSASCKENETAPASPPVMEIQASVAEGNTDEIAQDYYENSSGGKRDDPDDDIYDDISNSPLYESLPCNINEKQDSGLELQVTDHYHSVSDGHIYESLA